MVVPQESFQDPKPGVVQEGPTLLALQGEVRGSARPWWVSFRNPPKAEYAPLGLGRAGIWHALSHIK